VVNLYAESSAVLAWLLGESSGEHIRELLGEASLVIASDLTLLECDRLVIRAVTLGEINEAEAADCRAHLNAASTHWQMLRVSEDIIGRARTPFPGEPIRTLDAIHLASAIAARSAVAGVKLLSLDERVRRAARQLGFGLEPQ
jgi:predicted nucleic acid-binding protein